MNDSPPAEESPPPATPEVTGEATDTVHGRSPTAESPDSSAREPTADSRLDRVDESAVEAAPDAPVDSAELAENEPIPAESSSPPANTGEAAAPSFAQSRVAAGVAHRRLQRIEWGIVAGLALLLLVQLVASDFEPLAANAATRPSLQAMCNVLRCRLPPWREPQALHLLQRDVHADPQRPGALRISASFRNDARWPQPWPRLRVNLSDADGRAIAARDFAANEYLGANPASNAISSGQVASVAFDVVDPSPRVTAFTFEFR